MTCENATSARGLDGTEALKFFGLHGDLRAEADLAGSTADEGDTVGVHGLVDGGSTGLCASQGNTFRGLGRNDLVVAVTDPFDDGSFHGEFDQIEGEEPNNVLHGKT